LFCYISAINLSIDCAASAWGVLERASINILSSPVSHALYSLCQPLLQVLSDCSSSVRDICHYCQKCLNEKTIQDLMMYVCSQTFTLNSQQIRRLEKIPRDRDNHIYRNNAVYHLFDIIIMMYSLRGRTAAELQILAIGCIIKRFLFARIC
jgi:hypothetical protein